MDRKLLTIVIGLVAIAVAFMVAAVLVGLMSRGDGRIVMPRLPDVDVSKTGGFATFRSESEFREYIEAAKWSGAFGYGGGMVARMETMAVESPIASDNMAGTAKGSLEQGTSATAGRFSETNVQVAGIDEPDIVKTDGKRIYYSREGYSGGFISEPMPLDVVSSAPERMGMIAPYPYEQRSETGIFAAYPPEKLARIGRVAKGGEILLFGDTLVVFADGRREIIGYDLATVDAPEEIWRLSLARDANELVQARKYGGKLYLVARSWVNEFAPCPVVPFSVGGKEVAISCTDIYRPGAVTPTDSVYTVASIDPRVGAYGDSMSFVGSAGNTVVYMSPESVYVTFPEAVDPTRLILGFVRENGDLFPAEVAARLGKLSSYDIGPAAKLTEITRILEGAMSGRNADDRLRMNNEIANRSETYLKRHMRETSSTAILRISVDGLRMAADGSVPGTLLNQFSLDEYDGYLRVATTVGGAGGFMVGLPVRSGASENDIYVLDTELDAVGSLTGLGKDERIYAARFLGERGYVVTFRETDPFYVLDLSDPRKPRTEGELKIPGYSSYLHPLRDDLVLGIGRDGSQVKLSLFDVSDPDRPREASKYVLDEYWSEALDNHRAFLADEKHGVFFVPGGNGGYVFSFDGAELKLVKAISEPGVRRALYIGDTFYVVSDTAINAYSERTWERVGELDLE